MIAELINYARVKLVTRAAHSEVSEEYFSTIENYPKIIDNMIFNVKIRTEKPDDKRVLIVGVFVVLL